MSFKYFDFLRELEKTNVSVVNIDRSRDNFLVSRPKAPVFNLTGGRCKF